MPPYLGPGLPSPGQYPSHSPAFLPSGLPYLPSAGAGFSPQAIPQPFAGFSSPPSFHDPHAPLQPPYYSPLQPDASQRAFTRPNLTLNTQDRDWHSRPSYNAFALPFIPPHAVSANPSPRPSFRKQLHASVPSFVPAGSFRAQSLRPPPSPLVRTSPTASSFSVQTQKDEKKRKVVVRVPLESATPSENAEALGSEKRDEATATEMNINRQRSLFVRVPLEESLKRRRIAEMNREDAELETTSRARHEDENRTTKLPEQVDIYLPGRIGWQDMRSADVEEKLQRLGYSRPGTPRSPNLSISLPPRRSFFEFIPSPLSPHGRASHQRSLSTLPPRLQHAYDNRHSPSQSLAISPSYPFPRKFLPHSVPSPLSGVPSFDAPNISHAPPPSAPHPPDQGAERPTLAELTRGFGAEVIDSEDDLDAESFDSEVPQEPSEYACSNPSDEDDARQRGTVPPRRENWLAAEGEDLVVEDGKMLDRAASNISLGGIGFGGLGTPGSLMTSTPSSPMKTSRSGSLNPFAGEFKPTFTFKLPADAPVLPHLLSSDDVQRSEEPAPVQSFGEPVNDERAMLRRSSLKKQKLDDSLASGSGRRTPDAVSPSGEVNGPSPGKDNIREFKFPFSLSSSHSQRTVNTLEEVDEPEPSNEGGESDGRALAASSASDEGVTETEHRPNDYISDNRVDRTGDRKASSGAASRPFVLTPTVSLSSDGRVIGFGGPGAKRPSLPDNASNERKSSVDMAVPTPGRPMSRATAILRDVEGRRQAWSASPEESSVLGLQQDGEDLADDDAVDDSELSVVPLSSREDGEDDYEDPLTILEDILIREFDALRQELAGLTSLKADLDDLKRDALLDTLFTRLTDVLAGSFQDERHDFSSSVTAAAATMESTITQQYSEVRAQLAVLVNQKGQEVPQSSYTAPRVADLEAKLEVSQKTLVEAQRSYAFLVERYDADRARLAAELEQGRAYPNGPSDNGIDTSDRHSLDTQMAQRRIADLEDEVTAARERENSWHASEVAYTAAQTERNCENLALQAEVAARQDEVSRLRSEMKEVRQENAALASKIQSEREAAVEARGEASAFEKRLIAQEEKLSTLQQTSGMARQSLASSSQRAAEAEKRAAKLEETCASLSKAVEAAQDGVADAARVKDNLASFRAKMTEELLETQEAVQREQRQMAEQLEALRAENERLRDRNEDLELEMATVCQESTFGVAKGSRGPHAVGAEGYPSPLVTHTIQSALFPDRLNSHGSFTRRTSTSSISSGRTGRRSKTPTKTDSGWWE